MYIIEKKISICILSIEISEHKFLYIELFKMTIFSRLKKIVFIFNKNVLEAYYILQFIYLVIKFGASIFLYAT